MSNKNNAWTRKAAPYVYQNAKNGRGLTKTSTIGMRKRVWIRHADGRAPIAGSATELPDSVRISEYLIGLELHKKTWKSKLEWTDHEMKKGVVMDGRTT